MKKLFLLLLAGVIFSLSATSVLAAEVTGVGNYKAWSTLQEYEKTTGEKIEKFGESPMLRVKVASGELSPVEERIPEEPLVIRPVEEIGQYGGTAWEAFPDPVHVRGHYRYFYEENLVCRSPSLTEILPNIAKDFKVSEDVKTWTFYLRKGMKWSDGAPFTADDFIFGWNEVLLNKELYPGVPGQMAIGGKAGKIKKIDDYTFEINFPEPYGMFSVNLVTPYFRISYPQHYLKQFHPAYTAVEKIEEMIKKEGFTIWVDYFTSKMRATENPEVPTIRAFKVLNPASDPIQTLSRNPYFWKIDTQGNQLPYIDEIRRYTQRDSQAITLLALAGEIDYTQMTPTDMETYTLLMQNREEGDYRVVKLIYFGTNYGTLKLNLFHKDPVVRKLFRNLQFRIALSVAINRDEINQFLYQGLGNPSQPTPVKGTPWYVAEYKHYYDEYDLERANRILDEIGLEWDKNHEYRLRPDAKKLRFVIYAMQGWPSEVIEIVGFVKEYWKEIGVEVVIKPLGGSIIWPKYDTADFDIVSYAANMGYLGEPPVLRTDTFPHGGAGLWGDWIPWLQSDGKEGEEPPADVKRLAELRGMILAEPSMEKRIELTKMAIKIHTENMWYIGIIDPFTGMIACTVSNRMGNFTGADTLESSHFSEYSSQWFLRK